MFVYCAGSLFKPWIESLFSCIAVDFNSRVVAVVEAYLVYGGIDKRRTEGMIVHFAIFELREKVPDLFNGENRTCHLLFSKLYLKIGFLYLPLLDL